MFSKNLILVFQKKEKKEFCAPSNKGFTLVELLVVIAVIAILASVVSVGVRRVRESGRDARRLSDMRQIQLALESYFNTHGHYPFNTDPDCGSWDFGFSGGSQSGDLFIQPLRDGRFIETPGDPVTTGSCDGYAYFRYSPGEGGCDPARGAFFVLAVGDMETSGRPHPRSPGFSCSGRNWQTEFDWVVGGFER